MTDPTPPGGQFPSQLPSSRTLVRSTVIAVAVAGLLLVAVVLPAEYGVDLTGVGRVLGLTQMGEIKVALAREAAADAVADSAAAAAGTAASPAPDSTKQGVAAPGAGSVAGAPNEHETKVTLRPGEGKEVKLVMRRGARATYSWSTDRGAVNFLTHGDTVNAPEGTYHAYGRGSGASSDEGVIVAVFDGNHGWFWRNRTTDVLTVTLRTTGEYQQLKEPK
jgi:hypothetical protein